MRRQELNMMQGLRMVLEDSEVGNPGKNHMASKNHIVSKIHKASKNHKTRTSIIRIRTSRMRMIKIHITGQMMIMLGIATAKEKQIVAGVNKTRTGKMKLKVAVVNKTQTGKMIVGIVTFTMTLLIAGTLDRINIMSQAMDETIEVVTTHGGISLMRTNHCGMRSIGFYSIIVKHW